MKKYKVLFSSAVFNDLNEAKRWYNTQQKGLGKRLVEDVKQATASIRQNPFHASIKLENIRTTAYKVFPYSLHYEIDEANALVRIVFIFHFSRKPYWLKDE